MKKVVIAGCGFAGLYALRKLYRHRKNFSITVIEPKETFDFLPLLPDLLGRGFDPDSVSVKMADLKNKFGFELICENTESIDLETKTARTRNQSIKFDYLILSCGVQTSFSGAENIKEHAYTFRSVKDAQKILSDLNKKNFESVIISGGGYTGIEIATNLKRRFMELKNNTRVIIVEKNKSVLYTLPGWIKEYAVTNLKRMNIETVTESTVESIDQNEVALSGNIKFKNAMLIWVAGTAPTDLVASMYNSAQINGRLKIDKYMRLNDCCFAAGDCASFMHNGRPARMAILFSIAGGVCAAKNIINTESGTKLVPCAPIDLGYAVPMANNRSCGIVMGINIKGKIMSLMHYIMSILRSYGIKKKIAVLINSVKGW